MKTDLNFLDRRVERRWNFFELTLAFTLIGITTSRFALVAHELLGHMATGMLFGCRPSNYFLFWFAGGYASSSSCDRSQPAALLFYEGGILVQLFLGGVCLLIKRKLSPHSVWSLFLSGFALLVITHGLFYFAQSLYYGFSDGYILYTLLGRYRLISVLFAAACNLVLAFLLARELSLSVRRWMTETRRIRFFVMALSAALLACLAHGVLAFGEMHYFPQQTYVSIKEPEYISLADEKTKELQEKMEKETGQRLSDEQSNALKKELYRQLRPFPMETVFIPALLFSLIGGLGWEIKFGKQKESAQIQEHTPRPLLILTTVFALSMLMIGILKLGARLLF